MDILGIGFAELMFILVIAMMVFGPRRLPEIAAKAGKMVGDLRRMSRGVMIEWQREINAATQLDEELKKTRDELVGVKNELAETKRAVISDTSYVAKAVSPAALAAEIEASVAASTPATPAPEPDETASAAAEPDAVPSTGEPPDSGDPSEPPAASIAPPAAAPSPVSRPLVTTRNGAADAPTREPATKPEITPDEH
ncbi:MAG: hypothetical protein Kow0031_28500 [Anaerolineae bacterium]